MRIAVYSGSFDPLHIGHLSVMRSLAKSDEVDGIYLVVSPQNPFKSADKANNAKARYESAVKSMEKYPELNVRVDDIELFMPPPQYTVRTLDALKNREPENSFVLVMGADCLAQIRGWKDYRRILMEYGILVYPRDGYDVDGIISGLMKESELGPVAQEDMAELDNGVQSTVTPDNAAIPYNIRKIDAPMVNVSSTMIRESLSEGRDVSGYLI